MKLPLVTAILAASLLAVAMAGPAGARTLEQSMPTAAPTTRLAAPSGDGSYLALVDRGRMGEMGLVASSQRLLLIDSDGTRHVVLSRQVRHHDTIRLEDWSADARTALLLHGSGPQQALLVDVSTGRTHPVPLGDELSEVLLAPDGRTLIGQGYHDQGPNGAPLWMIDRSGERTPLPFGADGRILAGHDDTIVTGGPTYASHSVQVRSLTDGSLVSKLRTPVHCEPVRWWSHNKVLVSCSTPRLFGHLRLLDVNTGAQRWLTAAHPKRSRDLGDLDARTVASGLYLQASGPCGVVFVAKARPHGRVTPLEIRDAVGNVLLIDSTGKDLVIEHAMSCDGAAPRAALARYNPVTHRERTLALLRRDEAFDALLVRGEGRATGY
ncbi:hypothetical protein [Nocardioides sp.]|uniref:hypothetical protein n=1 Tax=Nocardioides sp. TaxID=35761 RepID=UPI0031FEF13C|nr:hypothetical protein [Nocardioides sp.]